MPGARFTQTGGGGGVSVGGSSDTLTAVRFLLADFVPTGSDIFTGKITGTYLDTVNGPTDAASLKVTLPDVVNAATDAKPVVTVRYFSTAASDNDSAKTTPANANGGPDGVFATVKTNESLGDLANPVTISSGVFPIPGSVTGVAKTAARLRVWFKIAAPAAALTDTITLTYFGAGTGAVYTAPAGVYPGVDNSATGLALDVSGLTVAQLQTIQIQGSYTATVVAVPQTALLIDAWCVEVDYQT